MTSPTSSLPLPFGQRSAWVWSAEGTHAEAVAEDRSPSHYQVRRFRLVWQLPPAVAAAGRLHVSADSRYVLFCNGERVGRGPAKGDIDHHFYDSYELGPWLVPGANVLAALVLDMSKVAHRPSDLGAPGAVMTYAGGFLAEGTLGWDDGNAIMDTGKADWRVAVDREYRFQNDDTRFEGYHGYFEDRHDGPDSGTWLRADYDDSGWDAARVLYRAERWAERRDPASPYGLVPRMIPPLMEGLPRPFAAGFLPGGKVLPADWMALVTGQPGAVVVPPHSSMEVILDTGKITTGYPSITGTGGAGALVRLTYAEALRLPWNTPDAALLGDPRSLQNLAAHYAEESTGWTFDRRGTISGWSDCWRPAGSASDYEPLHWRAFRFIGVKVTTGAEAFTITGLSHRYCAYPHEIKATFHCDDPAWEKIWDAGLLTMQLCSHETFEDCPHYEQMQYAGDTMITSHLSMLTTGDHRLSRQALWQFDWSRGPEGLTASRYPSRLRQVIPSWSLHWITAVRDFGLCSGDLDTVRDIMPGMRGVLDWFRRHCDDSRLPARLPYWNMTDWCPWWPRGVVPGTDHGPTCIISAQWIQALEEVAQMAGWLGRDEEAARLVAEAAASRRLLHQTFWSEKEGLYYDQPGGPQVSQYGNAWAVACGAADAPTMERLRQRFPHDDQLAPGSFFAWHTIFAAMERMGIYHQMADWLGPWHESIELGLDTFAEENSYWRSLCHAWSAHPALEFLQRVLGVRATSPGFATVRVQPFPGPLNHAAGRVCTPRGPIAVSWKREGVDWSMRMNSPKGISVEIVLPDGSRHRSQGGKWAIGEFAT